MSNFIARFEKDTGDWWEAEFTEDYLIAKAWHNGKRVKLTPWRELVLYHTFKKYVDLKAIKRMQKTLTRR